MNSKTVWTWIAVIVIVVVGGWFIFGNSSQSEAGPIKIGFIGPLTGDAANIGQNAKAAIQIAVDEVNNSGGINGRQIEMIYEDGQCTGAPASSAANKLINVDKVSAILGGACSGETLAFVKTANDAHTPVLSYCSSAPAVTDAGDYIFRDYPSDNFQGKFAADYLYNTLGKRSVALLYAKTDWANGIGNVFTNEFTRLGGKIILNEGFSQNTTDVRSILAKVKAANPDAVYFLGYTNESIVALNQAHDLGLKTTWLGGDAWDDSKIWSVVGQAGEGVMYTVAAANPTETFKTAMRKQAGSDEIAVCTPTAYDAINIIAQVMKQDGTSADAIKNGLYHITYTGGVSSDSISFDQNGDLAGANYAIKKVHNGVAASVTQ